MSRSLPQRHSLSTVARRFRPISANKGYNITKDIFETRKTQSGNKSHSFDSSQSEGVLQAYYNSPPRALD